MSHLHFSHGPRKYTLHVERQGQEVTLRLESDGDSPQVLRARVEGAEPRVVLHTEGRSHRLSTMRAGDGVWVSEGGRTWFLKHERAASRAASAEPHPEVRAPMTGKVIQVLAQAGSQVAAGQLLAVMEAMKMEYRLEAPSAGCVEKVHCREGDLLNVGALLFELTPA